MTPRPDPVALVSGAVIAALAGVFIAVDAGALEIPFGWTVPILTGSVALVLLVAGLTGGDRR